MEDKNLEQIALQMGDVGAVIDMIDRYLCEGDVDNAHRAVTILIEAFESRYSNLLSFVYAQQKIS